MVGWARRGPRQADHYDWLSAYLKERGLQTRWRITAAGFMLAFSMVPMVMRLSPAGPDDSVTTAMSVFASACGVGAAVLWMLRWPTRRQSALFCAVTTVAIAATCLAQSDPYVGLMGCTVFATLGGFVAYFHTVGHTLLNFVVAAVASTILTYRLISSTGDVALAGSALLTVAALNVGVPFGIHSLVHALRRDLRSSDHDALTGLLNRRAFGNCVYEMIMRQAGAGSYLIVTMIDLDNFKSLNDTHGHSIGDQALMAVGAALRESCRPTAVIGRAGGEEFVIADTDIVPHSAESVERMRRAIAATPYRITASVETASAPVDAAATTTNLEMIGELIRSADEAMYEAKRSGGNQVRHRLTRSATPQPRSA